jgi:hypothetical protein
MPNTRSKSKTMQPLNPSIPSYRRNADIIIPEATNRNIQPQKIFEGYSEKKPQKKKAQKVKK